MLFGRLVNALRLVASPGSVQQSIYGDGVAYADEVALDYSEIFQQASILLDKNEISSEIYNMLLLLDDEFDGMSKNLELWNEEEFLNGKKWEYIRSQALSILERMEIPYKIPDSENNKFIF